MSTSAPRLGRAALALTWLTLIVTLGAIGLAPRAALAAGGIDDAAGMFSAQARQTASERIAAIERDTGKGITVVTVPSLGGKDINAVATTYFQDHRLNGVLIYIARDERRLAIKVGVNTRAAIPTSEEAAIRQTITSRFSQGDFDGGLLAAIDRIGADLRAAAPGGAPAPRAEPSQGRHWFPILLIAALGFLALFLIAGRLRHPAPRPEPTEAERSQPYPPGYGGFPPYGVAPRGGGFWSGFAGGLGGAIAGSALYDLLRREGEGGGAAQAEPGDWSASDLGQVSESPEDVGGWGDDAGQVSDWGDGGGSDW